MAGVAERGREVAGSIAGSVVGHHGLDLDAGVGEERAGASPEPGGRLAALVAEDLRIGESAAVIDGVVQEGVPHPAVAIATPVGPAEHPVTAAVRDAAELLDVDVDELAGLGLLVADRLDPADWQARRLVDVREQRHPVAGQDAADRRPRHTEVVADPVWPPAPAEPQRDDPALELARRPRRRTQRPRGAIGHRQPGAISDRPFHRGRGRTLESLCRPAGRPALLDDQPSQPKPTLGCERRVRVSHEDLRGTL